MVRGLLLLRRWHRLAERVDRHDRPGFRQLPTGAYQVYCAAASCTGAGRINLTSVTLTASESQGPILTPEGSGNLWFQTRPGEWIWNPPGDPWPLTVAASDPSGVCSMSASVGLHQLPGPSAVPNTSVWQQCPDPTWTPGSGASVDTRDYLATARALPLTISAINAAGLNTSDSETLHVDNEPVDVALSTSNDASRTVWANHAVTVFATPNAGPSGVGGMNCSVEAAVHSRTRLEASRSTATACTRSSARRGTTRWDLRASRTARPARPRCTSTRPRRRELRAAAAGRPDWRGRQRDGL